ncbi:MAG TPA: hypothetical protein VII26_01430 [Candidatus Limnocylindria bacterium]
MTPRPRGTQASGEALERTPLNPDEATQRDEVRQAIRLFSAAAAAFGVTQVAVGLAFGSPRALITGLVFAALAAWLAIFPGRTWAQRPVASVVGPVAVVITAVLVAAAPLQPFGAIARRRHC